MKIVVFGATGTIGKHVVEQALAAKHIVTAFVRNPQKLGITNPNLRYVIGDVLRLDDVRQGTQDQDGVICVLGAGAKGQIRAEGTRNIIIAMKEQGIKRLICQSSLGVGDSKGTLNFFWKYIMFGLLLKKAYRDHEVQEKYVMESDLDWTITRPAAFTDGPRTGQYKVGFPGDAKGLTLKISRADVADLIMRELTGASYLRKAVGQSY